MKNKSLKKDIAFCAEDLISSGGWIIWSWTWFWGQARYGQEVVSLWGSSMCRCSLLHFLGVDGKKKKNLLDNDSKPLSRALFPLCSLFQLTSFYHSVWSNWVTVFKEEFVVWYRFFVIKKKKSKCEHIFSTISLTLVVSLKYFIGSLKYLKISTLCHTHTHNFFFLSLDTF